MLEVGKQLIFYAPIAHLTLKGTPMGVKQVTLLIQSLLLMSYGHTVHLTHLMNFISVNRFRDNLKLFIEQVVNDHAPIKVTRRAGEDFLVMSADDWKREQETLHVLQSSSLMQQIADSLGTHSKAAGYKSIDEQLNEITGL
jgi:antitoxin YefM